MPLGADSVLSVPSDELVVGIAGILLAVLVLALLVRWLVRRPERDRAGPTS